MPSFESAFELYEEAVSTSTLPHSDKNKKHQSATSIDLCLKALDARISANEKDAISLFLRGRARKHSLTLRQPCADYDDLVLEYLADMVEAVQLEPQNDEFVARLAAEKLSYTIELERHCLSLGESLSGEGIIQKSVAMSWGHTMEIARSALAIKSITPVNRLLALPALCHALFATGNHEECEKQVDHWIEICPKDNIESLADALVLKATFQYQIHGSAPHALKTLETSLQHHPKHVESLLKRATIERDLRCHSDAVLTWKRLIELKPYSADFHYRSAADYELSNDKVGAVAALKRSLEISPKHLFALNDLAYHHIGNAEWADALPLLQEVLSQGPNDDIPWINIANVLYHLNDYEQALRSIKNAFSAKRVGNRPPSAEEWLIKIAILRALSNQTSAPSESSEIAASSSSATETTVRSKIDFEPEIIKCFVQALKAADKLEQAQAYFEYADYLVEKGQLEQARTKMAFALKIRPGATLSHLNLTRLALQPGTHVLYQELAQ